MCFAILAFQIKTAGRKQRPQATRLAGTGLDTRESGRGHGGVPVARATRLLPKRNFPTGAFHVFHWEKTTGQIPLGKNNGAMTATGSGMEVSAPSPPDAVPGTGLEPVRPQWPRDFKSLVSANSTIWATLLHLQRYVFCPNGKRNDIGKIPRKCPPYRRLAQQIVT